MPGEFSGIHLPGIELGISLFLEFADTGASDHSAMAADQYLRALVDHKADLRNRFRNSGCRADGYRRRS